MNSDGDRVLTRTDCPVCAWACRPKGHIPPSTIALSPHSASSSEQPDRRPVSVALSASSNLARTLCDLGAVVPLHRVEGALDDALRWNVSERWILETLDRVDRPGPSWTATLRRILALPGPRRRASRQHVRAPGRPGVRERRAATARSPVRGAGTRRQPSRLPRSCLARRHARRRGDEPPMARRPGSVTARQGPRHVAQARRVGDRVPDLGGGAGAG